MKKLLGLLVALMLSAIATPGGATIIYDNGLPSMTGGYISDYADFTESADDFTLEAGKNIITDIHWWGEYSLNNLPDDDFTIKIFDTSDIPWLGEDVPGNEIVEITSAVVRENYDSYTDVLGAEHLVYSYEVVFDPLLLNAGQKYWLYIVNNTSFADLWSWESAQITNSYAHSLRLFGDFGIWTAEDNELSFNLTGPAPIPEPTTILLSGLGLLSMGIYFRKRKK